MRRIMEMIRAFSSIRVGGSGVNKTRVIGGAVFGIPKVWILRWWSVSFK